MISETVTELNTAECHAAVYFVIVLVVLVYVFVYLKKVFSNS